MLSAEEGKQLLTLARKSIETYFSKAKLDLTPFEKFNKEQGVFVTLTIDGELRGCIGFPYPAHPLYKAVFEAARSAAFEDPRFPSLEKKELKEISVEISVLTVPQDIRVKSPEEYLKKIKIGEDGLIIKGRYTSGLLLPQVFTEYRCTPKQALEMTSQKAGMNNDAWKEPANKIFKFQAQIFKEQK
jgi:hypothetical protein